MKPRALNAGLLPRQLDTLRTMLHGRKIIRDVEVLAIAKALGVPVGELFEGN